MNVQQVDSAKAMLMKRQKEVEKASPIVVCCSIMSTDIDLPSLFAYLLLLQKWFWILLAKLEKKTPHVLFFRQWQKRRDTAICSNTNQSLQPPTAVVARQPDLRLHSWGNTEF